MLLWTHKEIQDAHGGSLSGGSRLGQRLTHTWSFQIAGDFLLEDF